MGLFKKFKDILFDEEEYTEQIKITPEMRNEETAGKDAAVKKAPVAPEKKVKIAEEDYPKRTMQKAVREERVAPQEEVKPTNSMSERELFKSESTFPFLDFDEEEFDHQKPATRVQPKVQKEPVIPKRSTNVFEYEKKRKVEKRTDYGRFEKIETTESVERKKFKPSPIISPVYGILNQDYVKEEIMNKTASSGVSRTPDLNEVRQKAFGDNKVNTIEEIPEKRSYYEEKTVTITRPEEKQKKVKTIDELLEDTADVEIDANISDFDDEYDELPRLNKRKEESYKDDSFDDTKEITKEMQMPDNSEDTLENDLFDLIDSMYDNKEDGD